MRAFGSASPTSSAAEMRRRLQINRRFSPPASRRASQYTAASGSDPRMLFIRAEITAKWSSEALSNRTAARGRSDSTPSSVRSVPPLAAMEAVMNSSRVRAWRASPPAMEAIRCKAFSSASISRSPRPRSRSARARFNSVERSSSDRGLSWKTTILERRVLLISNQGFSVVVPTRMRSPFSTDGRRAFCWLLLKWYISSTKAMAACPALMALRFEASATRSRSSETFAETALISRMSLPVSEAMSLTSVVFPTPGGPYRMQLGVRFDSRSFLRGAPGPRR